uniref:Winged helix-turn-helix transcriptional regulator n=1 Tax=Ignisphaera aggregans TaxID=334771 RepID=A0A7C5YWM7_9CREN
MNFIRIIELKIGLLLICFLSILYIPCIFAQEMTMVSIDEYGTALVEIHMHLDNGLQIIELPIEPIPETIIAVANEKPIPIIYENNTLYLIVEESSTIEISYIANISIKDGIFHLIIKRNISAILKIPIASIILLTLPREIISYKEEDNTFILIIKGPQELRYTLRIPTTPIQTSPPSTPISIEGIGYIWIYILTIVIVASFGIIVIYLIKRRKSRVLTEMLSDIDLAIIKILETKGGMALQTELQDNINIPRTTLWRHIKKLEKLGIVKVEKIGLQNRIVLIKKVKI